MYDILIKGGTIVDGTGNEKYESDIAINDKTIVAVGDLSNNAAREIIDATGLIVAPGFIDISNRSDTRFKLFQDSKLESLLYQGITTIVGGNSGTSLAPIYNEDMLKSVQKWTDLDGINIDWQSMDDFLKVIDKRKLSVNFATFVGYGTLRRGLVGDNDRELTSKEKKSIIKHVTESFKYGALGISTGLIYSHERNIKTEELIEVANIVAKNDKIYVAHLRDEGEKLLQSIDEVIHIQKESGAKVHVSHLKATYKQNWRDMIVAIEKLEKANIVFDMYPYTFSTIVLYTLLPDWISDGGRRMMLERLRNKDLRNRITIEMEDGIDLSKVVIAHTMYSDYFCGKTFGDIAKAQEKRVSDVVIDVLLASDGQVNVFLDSVSKENIVRGLQSKNSIISSNGVGHTIQNRNNCMEHPRSFGAFAKIFDQYVNKNNILSVEDAVHKATGKVAKELGIGKRGFLKKNFNADIVVFDLETFKDNSSLKRPYEYATGVKNLIINGQTAIKYGKYTGVQPGDVIKK
jgi:N-acyl-D-amino-acid deacylase